ncbi:MAG: NusA-like transcription termination signal-binding factor [Candidatus Bathyarchaeia archaeon]
MLISNKIKLTADEMRYIALFESVTGATSRDCLIDKNSNRIIFVTKPNEAGLAIGEGGSKVKALKRMTGRDIEIVEYAETPTEFIKNLFSPARIKEIRITEKLDGRKIAVVTVDPRDKGAAIGRGGEKAERGRYLVKRYYDIDNIIIT